MSDLLLYFIKKPFVKTFLRLCATLYYYVHDNYELNFFCFFTNIKILT